MLTEIGPLETHKRYSENVPERFVRLPSQTGESVAGDAGRDGAEP